MKIFIHAFGMALRAGWQLVPVPMSDEFVGAINAALPRIGYANRSEFIRDAIVEKLNREQIAIPPEMAAAPVRAGKGGRRKTTPRASAGARSFQTEPDELMIMADKPVSSAHAQHPKGNPPPHNIVADHTARRPRVPPE